MYHCKKKKYGCHKFGIVITIHIFVLWVSRIAWIELLSVVVTSVDDSDDSQGRITCYFLYFN